MDTFRASAGSQGRAPTRLRLPTPANIFLRGRKKLPIISDPIGPIKNSRGPDFTRSDTLIIVPAINDCSGSDESLSDKENNEARKNTRRISASFSKLGSLASPPTVAKSGLTVTSGTSSSKTGLKSISTSCLNATSASTLNSATFSHQNLSNAVPLKPLPTVTSFQNLPKTKQAKEHAGASTSFEPTPQDENTPLTDHKESMLPSAPQGKSRLPKSRTFGVLSDLKNSIPRPSKVHAPAADKPSRKTSASSTTSSLFASTSRLRLSRISLASRSSSSSTTVTPEVKPDPSLITKSQPSAYWSGRFVTLHDRFLAEDYSSEGDTPSGSSLGNLFEPHAMTTDRVAVNYRPTHLSYSTTTSALTSLTGTMPRKPPSTKDARCLRIFQHLESLCTTNEARRSLLAWQQTYARRMGKPQFLPKGGRMEDTQTLIGKFFGGGPRTGGRQSLPAKRQSSGVPIAKKTKPASVVKDRGKRVSMN
ncbi:hypothetical protein F53441_7611 [Fusarium austroafricanum]|uniref:Uncharacterized protein n=1 Tax=Fusarium austroafricanum TaxID=2364996 RepID=A0A8H4KER7_9HYPO|nr:hypothetical protein F53441_7611 [Fusarium austroafricanum]